MKALVFIIVLATLAACSSNELDPGGLTISYTETQCSDPWVRPGSTSATGWPNDEQRAQAVINYLRENKVSSARNVRFVEVTPLFNNSGNNFAPSNGASVCQACTCPSGRRIDINIDEADWEQASKLGFKR